MGPAYWMREDTEQMPLYEVSFTLLFLDQDHSHLQEFAAYCYIINQDQTWWLHGCGMSSQEGQTSGIFKPPLFNCAGN